MIQWLKVLETLSTLLQGGFTREDLGESEVDKICDLLSRSLDSEGHLLGFGKAHSYKLLDFSHLTGFRSQQKS